MLQSVRRVEYLPAPAAGIPECFVAIAGMHAPTMVAIHGISRNAAEMASRIAQHRGFAEVNIVAPLFEKKNYGRYQQLLARRSHETPADQALFALLDRLAASHGIVAENFLLFGFSGGAQMAHRLAMLHPVRVSRLCAASAGWYLLPEPDLPYPYGLGEGCPVATDAVDFLDVPTTVIVGSRDNRIDPSVRQDATIVARQGTNRLRRARVWTKLMADRAHAMGKRQKVSLLTLEGASHDFTASARDAALLDHVADALVK